MYQDKNEVKNNATVVIIGFFLIVLVVFLFFSKASFLNKKNEKIAESEIKEQKQEMESYKSIKAEELFEKMTSQKPIAIIDIREAVLFMNEHIKDSKNIPLDELEMALTLLDKKVDYFIIDNSDLSPEEIQTIKILKGNGFESITYLEGGIFDWKNQLYPLVSIGDPNSFTDQSKVTYIKSEELKNLIPQETSFLYIIDLRNKNSFNSGHINQAVNIPLENLENQRRQIPLSKKIILYDDDGMLAFQGAVRLFDMGILNVFTLSDGLNTWKQKGFEVVK